MIAPLRITDLPGDDELIVRQVSELLLAGFENRRPHPWPTITDASEQVRQSLNPDWLSLVALNRDERVIGWIAGTRESHGNVWRLYPLVVSAAYRGQGVGTALVQTFEKRVCDYGALTLWVAVDAAEAFSGLNGIDLYLDPLRKVANSARQPKPLARFFGRAGFTVVGALPDANGLGKPDVLFSKRVRLIQ